MKIQKKKIWGLGGVRLGRGGGGGGGGGGVNREVKLLWGGGGVGWGGSGWM